MGFIWNESRRFLEQKSKFNGFDQSGYTLGIRHAQNGRATLGIYQKRGYKFSDLT
jgi:hypothetical protein